MAAVAASIQYGESYGWTDAEDAEMRFPSVAAILRELERPGAETGHPRSYFPCAGDWSTAGMWRTVAFVYMVSDQGVHTDYPMTVVLVGPRGGLRCEHC
jgi:hypothetical protein